MSHNRIYDDGDTVQLTFRLTQRQLHLIRKVRKSRPHIRTNAEALRYIFDLVLEVPEPVYIVSGLAPLDDVKQFHKDIAKLTKCLQNLRSCLAGDMVPEAYDDLKMQETIADLRAQAMSLPDKLRPILGHAQRMAPPSFPGPRGQP